MKALITGGAGFIGSHLAEKLLTTDHEVIAIDNLCTGSLQNIAHIKNNPAFKFVHDDIRNQETMHLLTQQCDIVYHLAAAVGVKLIVEKPVHTIETNISGTEVVLEAANKFGKKILLASSSEVYGKSESIPFREDDDIVLGSTTVPRWSYACSKAIDEFLGLAFYNQYGLNVVIGRFFNTIGPRQTGQYGMVVPRFVKWALSNEPVLVYGSGQQKRCFCYVADLVEAVISLMNHPQAAGRVYNIGSDEEVTIEALADKVIKLTDSKSKKEFVPYQKAYGTPMEDMMRRVPSLERIGETIGWKPKTSLDEALKLIIKSSK